jgi:peptidoglycan/xylan/chitin deacetylase (PgdA/CDA1 family)
MRHRFRARSKSVIGRWIFRGGLHRRLFRNAAIVVTFHRVNNSGVGDGLTCDVEAFKQYCSFFIQYFHVVSLRDLVEKLEKGTPLDHELVITFDDGYEDNYECAAPVLKAMGLPATFFVASQYIGTHGIAWWDRHLASRQSWMTWDQVQWLGREGFEIGAHTRTHINLGEASGSEAWDEILGSRLELEEKLSTRIDLFAYPYGKENDISEETREMTKAAGFRCCCSCFGGVNPMGADPYYLRRIPMSSWYTSPHHFGFEVALRRA